VLDLRLHGTSVGDRVLTSRRRSRPDDGYRWAVAGSWQWLVDDEVRIGVTTSRRERTTSTVVISGKEALLIDPGWDPDELAWIADDLAAAGIVVTAGFGTHAHHDHLLWHPGLGAAPRWASVATTHRAGADLSALIQALGPGWPVGLAPLVGQVTEVTGSSVPWDGPTVELITHDAHAKGHTALWIPSAATLIAGDMLSDVELPLLEDSSPADYADGLTALRPCVEQARVVIPGHGRPAVSSAAARARWTADKRYLAALVGGTDPADPRQLLPGMREAHAHNSSRVAR
jgi:glyoxylase-like metal-dependent hydrolase (beta-lactamase superfamily II)